MLNRVTLIGRLGQDPELRYGANGTPVVTLRIATNEGYTDKDGNKVDRTEWHSVVAFQRQAENCANYLTKGSLIYVEGSLQTRQWQDQQGQTRYTTDIRASRIQFLERKGGGQGQPYNDDMGDPYAAQGKQPKPKAQTAKSAQKPYPQDEDLGPAFPSEASNMDDVPF
ncbi:single-stranded DNA-binding protein [Desulfovibrio litoralis]|uniref:Single-stranded DNA-binding protein n=1 Tax=Desulfovibrio litoralis DSM 11393 TaxID=1121455 RepID=A0A1M7SZD8_9BACT|nr:single-stranded DNA-binding protein [Desulfovibrio litoralis]SHN63818.1 single-strand binding protein [Desulfovibrio litoralis DSM 11393]